MSLKDEVQSLSKANPLFKIALGYLLNVFRGYSEGLSELGVRAAKEAWKEIRTDDRWTREEMGDFFYTQLTELAAEEQNVPGEWAADRTLIWLADLIANDEYHETPVVDPKPPQPPVVDNPPPPPVVDPIGDPVNEPPVVTPPVTDPDVPPVALYEVEFSSIPDPTPYVDGNTLWSRNRALGMEKAYTVFPSSVGYKPWKKVGYAEDGVWVML